MPEFETQIRFTSKVSETWGEKRSHFIWGYFFVLNTLGVG